MAPSVKIKGNDIALKSSGKLSAEGTKVSINDGTGKISPMIVRKVIRSISTTLMQLKPISHTGVCTPDPLAVSKMSVVDSNFIKEPVVININKEKTKE